MAEIVLIRPGSGNRQVAPPMGLLYLASYVRKHLPGLSITVIDGQILRLSEQEIGKIVADKKPLIAGITSMSRDAPQAHFVAREIRKHCQFIVMGGPHPSSSAEEALADPSVDFAVIGEGEEAFLALVKRIMDGAKDPAEGIPGVAGKGINGLMRVQPRAEVLQHPDEIPFPAYDLIDLEKYFSRGNHPGQNSVVIEKRVLPLLTSRGCPFSCVYCHNVFGRKFRPRSISNVVGEIESLHARYGVRSFEIYDDVFNLNRDRVLEFSDTVAGLGGGLTFAFSSGIRGDLLDEETLDGLIRINFGIESPIAAVRKRLGKRMDLGKVMKMADYAVRRGVMCGGFFLLGSPDETEAEVLETIRFAASSRLHTASFNICTPFPGTRIYRERAATSPGAKPRPATHYGDVSDEMNISRVPAKRLLALQRKAYLDFYTRPARIYRILKDAPSVGSLAAGFATFLRYAVLGEGLFWRSER
jgi:anaerobic magnesium-protoporphyrin IX monomethyl ester cyclase